MLVLLERKRRGKQIDAEATRKEVVKTDLHCFPAIVFA